MKSPHRRDPQVPAEATQENESKPSESNLENGPLKAQPDEAVSEEAAQEAFVQLLTEVQLPLLHYIATLLGDVHVAQNVLQETNLVLWRKSRDYRPGTKFSTWAHSVAYWQVKAYVRDRGRDRHVFDEQLIDQLAAIDPAEAVNQDVRIALRHCLAGVSSCNRELLRMRYDGGQSIKSLAKHVGKTPSAVKVGLMRIRKSLLKCIERKLAAE